MFLLQALYINIFHCAHTKENRWSQKRRTGNGCATKVAHELFIGTILLNITQDHSVGVPENKSRAKGNCW